MSFPVLGVFVLVSKPYAVVDNISSEVSDSEDITLEFWALQKTLMTLQLGLDKLVIVGI